MRGPLADVRGAVFVVPAPINKGAAAQMNARSLAVLMGLIDIVALRIEQQAG